MQRWDGLSKVLVVRNRVGIYGRESLWFSQVIEEPSARISPPGSIYNQNKDQSTEN